jgi:hypothetical protein
MTRYKLVTLCAAVVATGSLLLPVTVFAEDGEDSETKTTIIETPKSAEERKKLVEEKAKAIREQVKTQREEIKTKLTDTRLKACEKRQTAINRVAKNSSTQANKHLGTFQKIEARVKEFYASKNLTVENYDALVATVDEKEASATAAIKVAGETTFDCATTDSAQPGGVIKGLVQSQHQALKEYRTAIKNLIVAVKQAAGKEQ